MDVEPKIMEEDLDTGYWLKYCTNGRRRTNNHRKRKYSGNWMDKMQDTCILRFRLSPTDIDPHEEYAKIINYVSVSELDGVLFDLHRLPLMMKSMRKTPTFEAVYSSLWGTILWFATNQLV